MKKILIISATLKNNYRLAQNIENILKEYNVKTNLISLENYNLPIYTDDIFEKEKDNYKNIIDELTKEFVSSDGLIICGPEYNGSIPPIINNSIAWISTSTDYWRDAFNNKLAIVATSSGGPVTKFITTMKLQLEHLGCIVLPRSISSNKSNPLNEESVKKILKKFISLI